MTLGGHLFRQRTIRGLHQEEAAKLIGVCGATYLNWEKDQRKPVPHHWPAVIHFLGYDPYPTSQALGERMAALRRSVGWSFKEAAQSTGIDEGTWRKIELGLQSPMSRVSSILLSLLCGAQ